MSPLRPSDDHVEGDLSVGRDLANALCIHDPLVSRFHARIESGHPAVLHDLGSFRGTYLDGQPVRSPVALESGASIAFGHHNFRWGRADTDPS